MTPEDLELLLSLRHQQQELRQSLAKLDFKLDELETRMKSAAPEVDLPPLPPELPPELPPLPVMAMAEPVEEPPAPPPFIPEPEPEPAPPVSLPPVPKPSFEFQLGRWLTRVGAVFLVLSIVFFAVWADVNYHIHQLLGAWGKLGIMGAVSGVVLALGQRLESRRADMLAYGRTLMAAGLAGLYFTLYAAHYIPGLIVINSPIVAGFLLLLWSVYVFFLAEERKSETLSLFAIALAYFSSAINPMGGFTMAADLLLAFTALVFLLRNGWAALSYFSLAGTYLALLRRLVLDENGELVLDTSRTLTFWPHAVYLIGAWLIFTAAVLLSTAPGFRGGKRLAFLSLNNGALAGLLALTAYVAGYGYGAAGRTLLTTGLLLLGTSYLGRWGRNAAEAAEISGAYLAQGLALVTGGIMMVYSGISRGVLLGLETFFLGMAGAFSRNRILLAAAYATAFFTTLFLLWEIVEEARHPWLLGVGGMAVMLANAWWSRREVAATDQARQKIVLSSSYYCALALGLIFLTMSVELSADALPPALAFAALALTFSIYLLPLYELPPLAQTLLVSAQVLVLFPEETGAPLSRWSTGLVATVTLLVITWWSRQRVTRYGTWIVVLNFLYALALVGLTYQAVRPAVDLQGWMVASSLLSLAFLIWGAFTRVWPLAAMGQMFLAAALYHFFMPPGGWDVFPYPWSWWAMAIPLTVVFSTGRSVHAWLEASPEITGTRRSDLRMLGYFYQGLTLALAVRAIAALVPAQDQIAMFFFLGSLLLVWNIRRESSFGVRCSFVFSAMGMLTYLQHDTTPEQRFMATFVNGLAVFFFLCQPGWVRQGAKVLVSNVESWALILLSALMGWIFISAWVISRIHVNYLTMGWALYALFLFLFGLMVREKRQCQCGLLLLAVAIARVFIYDFWGFSSGYRVLTFVVMAIVTLSLGFLYARFGDRLKTWLL